MTPEELQELCALYVLGALEPQNAAALETRLQARDPDIVREVAECRRMVELLPHALPPRPPHPAVRARLMARVRTTSPESETAGEAPVSPSSRSWFRTSLVWLPTAAAVVLAVLLGWLMRDLHMQLEALQAENQHLRAAAAEHERLVTLLTAPNVAIVALDGTEHAPQAGARLFWDRKRGEWTIIAYGLPDLPPGKVYQLWGLTSGPPLPFGTFRSDSSGMGHIEAKLSLRDPDVAGVAVSLEPEGGVPQPTGGLVLVQKF